MTRKRGEISIWVQIITFAILWIIVLKLSGTSFSSYLDSLKKIPDVVFYYIILFEIFRRWIWRWKIFRKWLVVFPDLQGTWKGTLQTTWVNPKTGKVPGPIPLTIVIRQSFDDISCVMYTSESSSTSIMSLLDETGNNEVWSLSYLYTNKPNVSVRERSIVHDGTAVLRFVNKPEKILTGEYWTNRFTTGDIMIKFISSDLEETQIS